MKTIKKIFVSIVFIALLVCSAIVVLYLKGLPYLVSHPKVLNFASQKVNQLTNADLTIENPVLKTSLSPEISFKVGKIYLSKDEQPLLNLDNFSTALSFREIFSKKIILKKLVAESVFADITSLEKLNPKSDKPKQEQKNDWNFEIEDSLLGVKNLDILYDFNPETKIKLHGEKIGVNNSKKIMRNVRFQLLADIEKNGKHVELKLNDNGNVFFAEKKFHIQSCPLSINNSDIFIDLIADKKQNYDISLYSDNFNINDILDFLNTQIIENNVQDSLVYFSELSGNIDFKLNIKNDDLNGNFKINEIKAKVKDVDNIPITINKGNVELTSDIVSLKGIEGFYDNNPLNKIDLEGTVKDYLKTIDTQISANATVRNDFFKKHLSKMIGTQVEIVGDARTKINITSKNNIMDYVWYFMLKPGQNIKIANDFLPFEENYRMMKSEMHLENNILDIKSLDYHMISTEQLAQLREKMEKIPKSERGKGEKPKPIFVLNSSVDLGNNNNIKFIGFEIPKPLPSELLNAVLKQQIFKRGKISGKLIVDNSKKYPVLSGTMTMDKVLIPSQMTFIKEATLEAKDSLIHLNASGGYRRAKFKFDGDVLNEIKLPVIVKDVNLSLENIDAFKLMEVFNDQSAADDVITAENEVISVENTDDEFDIRNVIIEKCNFHLDKGTYKEIEFGNLDAELTLDKDGVIDIKSNRFDFASGISSLRAKFDLINKQYNVKLGVLNVNSDTIANALMDLKREITGKASGFLDLTFDDSMKLSGSIKFKVSDGVIEKMGLVEYVLKAASLFRNAITMINPATLADIVNVPEGKFDKITGEMTLRNNVATRIKIKTYSSQLSTYIAGRYNIENGDTSLRVYTKFSNVKKGFTGFLRKISLGSLANRIPMNKRNDENYYAVELKELPDIEANEKDCQIFLTKFEGDVVNNNYISSLKKIK